MTSNRHRWLCISILVVTLGCVLPAFGAEEDWAWNYNLAYGTRTVSKQDWSPYQGYQELGVEASWGKAEEPLLFATDAYVARDRENTGGFRVESKAWEIDLGLRKTWTVKKRLNFSFGTGPALVSVDYEFVDHHEVQSESDRSYGWFFGGNIFYRLGSQLNLGIAARITPAIDMHIGGKTRPGNSTHLAFIIGWGAPLQAAAK